jgi:Mn2+/Fe2+ NRAMP family transporter
VDHRTNREAAEETDNVLAMDESATISRDDASISFQEKVTRGRSGFARRLWLLWALLGPGIISLLANNDAGGMISYTMTGATFGISFFLPLLFLLAPIGYHFQEMSMRLSAVTHTEYRELLHRHFGRFWSFTSVSTLTLANLMYIITEFVGMTAGLTLLGLPLWLSDIISFIFVGFVTFLMGYWSKERLALLVAASSAVFVVAAFLSHPDPAGIARVFTTWPKGLGNSSIVLFITATIGNTIAPFMLFFQNSATIDKGITAEDLRLGRADIALGALLQPLFAMTVMICGAALLGKVNNLSRSGPADLISALVPVIGHSGSTLFASGLFNAGWLAAITVSLSSAYTIAGSFGWRRSLNHRVSEAPQFYGLYFGSLLLGALIILIPGLPLAMMAVVAQITTVMLLVPDLIFLVLLTSNRQIMGKHVNRWWKRIIGWGMVVLYLTMSAATIFNTLAGM